MLRAIAHNAVLIGALVVGATVGGMSAPLLTSPRGAFGPGVLQADSLARGLLAVILTVGVGTGLAIVVARVSNTVVGLFALGGGLFGLAWRMDGIHEIVFVGSLRAVAIETILWSLVVFAVTVVVFRLGGPLRDVEPTPDGRVPHPIASVEALKSAAAGLLVLPVIWFVALSATRGQVIGAVFCGAMVAGLAGRLLSPHVQPVLLFAAPVLFGGLGHAAGAIMLDQPLAEVFVDRSIRPVSLPMPLDYACGALMGVAVGIGWARSFLHHEETAEPDRVGAS